LGTMSIGQMQRFLFSQAGTTKRHAERRILRTDPMHLFRIITDVDSYSKFLPLCSSSKVIRRSDCGKAFDASLSVGLPPFLSENYISRVHFDQEKMTVITKSIKSSMFDSLKSSWKLKAIPADNRNKDTAEDVLWCDVEFQVEMTVSNPIIVSTLDQVLKEVAGKQVSAFEKRCMEIPHETDS